MRVNIEIASKLAAYFIQKLGVSKHITGWYRRGTCPACGKRGKFGINILLNRTNCFSCGYHPDPIKLAIELEGLTTYNDLYKYLGSFEGVEEITSDLKEISEVPGKLPDNYKLIILGDSELGKLARTYMKKRGFNLNKIALKGVGYCTSGKYFARIIIPFYSKGRIIYFNARQFLNISEDKFKNPSMSEFGIGKSLLIYNSDCLYLYRTVYLMESAINCLTWGDDAFGIGGKIISDTQANYVIKSPCKNVVIVLDPDAYYQAIKTALLIVAHKRVKIVKLPLKADVNSIGRKRTKELIDKEPYLNYGQVYSRFLGEPKPEYKLLA